LDVDGNECRVLEWKEYAEGDDEKEALLFEEPLFGLNLFYGASISDIFIFILKFEY
jgi:hypothetical protein